MARHGAERPDKTEATGSSPQTAWEVVEHGKFYMMMEGAKRTVSKGLVRKGERFKLTVDVLLDRLVRENRAAVDVDLVANGHIVTKDCHVLQTGPATDSAVPTNNG